jgi:hypothetical protein
LAPVASRANTVLSDKDVPVGGLAKRFENRTLGIDPNAVAELTQALREAGEAVGVPVSTVDAQQIVQFRPRQVLFDFEQLTAKPAL